MTLAELGKTVVEIIEIIREYDFSPSESMTEGYNTPLYRHFHKGVYSPFPRLVLDRIELLHTQEMLLIGSVLGPVYAEYLYGSYKARSNAEIGQNSRYIRIGEHNLRIL